MVMGVVVVGTGLTGCKVDRVAQKEAAETAKIVNDPVRDVSTSSVEVKNVSEFLEVNGEIATSTDSQVSATTGGKIVSVFVREGDLVSAGQIVAQLDTENLQQQAAQARASLASARAQYSQASSNAQLAPGRTSAAVKQAEAALRSAKSQLQKALNGARDEDRDQANNNLRAAKSNLDTSKKQLDRVRTLVKEGALPESQLDTAKNAYEAALAQYENALVAVSVTKNASRPEDIESAKENVRQAEQALESAKTTKNLDVILKDQVEAAKAQIKSAEAQVQVAEKNLRESAVRAPFAGRIYGRPLQAGSVIAPGTPVVRIVSGNGIYFEGQLPSDKLGSIGVGTQVSIKVDSLGDRAFSGKIAAVSPQGESIGRMFNIRVLFDEVSEALRPGMFARGSVTVREVKGASMIPLSAVIERDGKSFVMVANGDKSKRVDVTTGIRSGEMVEVTGLATDAKVISQGQDALVDGSKIRISTKKEG